MSSKQEFVQTSLRILVAWTNGREPAPADVALLKNEFPDFSHLEADELACYAFRALKNDAIPGSEKDGGVEAPIVKDVA